MDPEIASKIKFAKYHALRIAKALKAGEDPNLSNPPLEEDRAENQPLDPNDPEVQALGGSNHRQPTVEEASDEHVEPILPSSTLPTSQPLNSSTSQAPSVQAMENPPSIGDSNNIKIAIDGEVSPMETSDIPSNTGYFPSVPDGYANQDSPTLPEAPPNEPGLPLPLDSSSSASHLPHEFVVSSSAVDLPTVSLPSTTAATLPPAQPRSVLSPSASSPATATGISPSPERSVTFAPDEEAIAKAQKHARWAISALNFDDVPTAITELRGALKILGAE